MRISVLLLIIFAVTLLALATFFSIIFNTEPSNDLLLLFYASLIIALIGLFSLGYCAYYYHKYKMHINWPSLKEVLRKSTVASVAVVLLLPLSHYKYANPYSIVAVIILAAFYEYFMRHYMLNRSILRRKK